MKNHDIPLLCLLMSAALVQSADVLGSTPTATVIVKKEKTCLFPKSRKRAPTWVCDAKVDGFAVTAVGTAAKSSAGIAFMEQMAAAEARAHLAQNLRGVDPENIGGSEDEADKKKMPGRGGALIPRIADKSLQGVKIIKRVYGPKGMLYVLVGLDEADAQKLHESRKQTPM